MHLPKEINSITGDMIINLINTKRSEDSWLEYKSSLPLNNDDKDEFLKDVVAFGNLVGGHIIYGIEADKKNKALPEKVVGVGQINPDQETLRLQSIINDTIEPRLRADVRYILVAQGTAVMVVYIHRNWNQPYGVRTNKGAFLYAMRNSAGTHRMALDEVRRLFQQTSIISERIRRFRAERVALVQMGEGARPIPRIFGGFRALFLHIIPLSTIDIVSAIEPYELAESDLFNRLVLSPISGPSVLAYGFDGLIVYTGNGNFNDELMERNEGDVTSYLQVFRNGICEFVDVFYLSGGFAKRKLILSPSTEAVILRKVLDMLTMYKRFEITGPFAVLVSLIGADGYKLEQKDRWGNNGETIEKIRHKEMLFNEIVLEEHEYDFQALAGKMKPVFDALANSAGLKQSDHVTFEDGKWVVKFDREGMPIKRQAQ